MIYLDNAATTFPKPECVYNKVNSVQRTIAVNVGRGSYSVASEAMRIVDETRHLLATFVGAAGPDSVVITPSATLASNEIILGLEWDSFKNVYVTPFEHNAIARPLFKKCTEHGIDLQIIPFDPNTHTLDEEELIRMFAANPPDYVFLNHVSNVTGTVIPIDKIAQLSKIYNALVIVDGSQSVGLIPINLSSSNIDYLIFAGHKNLYASWGIGGFICNSNYPLKPVLAGGTGSDSLNLEMSEITPTGFEFASSNIIAISSLNTSLKWLEEVSVSKIAEHKEILMQKLIDGLNDCGVQLYVPTDKSVHTSVLSFNIPDYDPDEIGVILNEDFDIAVRTGYHCAPFVHNFLNTIETKGTVRVSLSYFNTVDDVEALIAAVADIVGG
ncbi:MAG: aminotransferase class V-fold PLP-dependent enzyme [Acutalibacteraceae bacterium]|nr:aminotransferase class V-fold PLP-dependent enzyme [Acutalibacteraceae bacterium]